MEVTLTSSFGKDRPKIKGIDLSFEIFVRLTALLMFS